MTNKNSNQNINLDDCNYGIEMKRSLNVKEE